MKLHRIGRMAWLSRAAYKNPDDLVPALGLMGYELNRFIDTHGTQAILINGPDGLVLAFRGTEKDGKDILTDIDIRFRNDMHNGFLRAYKIVHQEVIDILAGRPVTLTGHSLGGALAQVAATTLPNATSCVSFGAPRVGNGDIADDFYCPHTRVVYGPDIVPWVPFALMGYRHTGDLLFLKPRGGTSTSKLRQALSFAATLPGGRLLAHRIDNYVDALPALPIQRIPPGLQPAPAQPSPRPPQPATGAGR